MIIIFYVILCKIIRSYCSTQWLIVVVFCSCNSTVITRTAFTLNCSESWGQVDTWTSYRLATIMISQQCWYHTRPLLLVVVLTVKFLWSFWGFPSYPVSQYFTDWFCWPYFVSKGLAFLWSTIFKVVHFMLRNNSYSNWSQLYNLLVIINSNCRAQFK